MGNPLRFTVGIFVLFCCLQAAEIYESDNDYLIPYKFHHGPKFRTNRQVRECQHVRYGNRTHSIHRGHSSTTHGLPVAIVKHVITSVGAEGSERQVIMRVSFINNPAQTVAVLEPEKDGTCQSGHAQRATVAKSAERQHCVVAQNAGFFNTDNGECLGNIVSDGRLVQTSGGIQNAQFGITKDGNLYTGYLSESDVSDLEFQQLVGGVIWLVRDGEVYVNESKTIECPDMQETGTLDRFVDVLSARSAVGHDADGRLMFVQVEGQTNKRGVNLWEFANILIDLGAINAINTDGGGSATTVVNGTLVSYPSDYCDYEKRFSPDGQYRCARKVSTILCAHALCKPSDCSKHGHCDKNQCVCEPGWSGPSCDVNICSTSNSNKISLGSSMWLISIGILRGLF